MVYPRIGKKRAEVNVEDRDRLREGEFLNDNLVGFYLRFLEDHLQRTNPDVAEGIYFFNSYFFPTLKNGRSINYSAVEKWTRNIDLFSYDYVIVPVNQDLHWYFAIICNLPSLDIPFAGPADQSSAPVSDKEISTQPESEVHEISESPEPELVSATTNNTFGAQFDQNRTEKEGKPATTEEVDSSMQGSEEQKQDISSPGSWPDGAENITSPPPKELPGRWWDQTNPTTSVNQFGLNSKKKGRPDLKLHPRQTTIITFDSLDLPRSPTIRLLREYICQEAVSKRGVEIDPKEIKGMRARQIPLQPNFSDCGLYLLAYIEKFVQDPDTFITRVMQRDMDAHADWPPLGSGMLRHRLRKFLDDMYEEQKKQESRSVMADQPRISYLLGPPLPGQEDDEDGLEEQRPATPGRSENSKPVQEDHVKGTSEDHLSIEIQVKATPPPGEPERPKKSPQGKRKG
jgi:Ulp1 family protease